MWVCLNEDICTNRIQILKPKSFFQRKGLLAVNITGHIFKTTDEPDTAVEMCIITNKHTEVC